MSADKYLQVKRNARFFLIALSHDSLVNYFQTNYQLMQNHNWTLTDIDSMMPWEREIYVTMLADDLKAQKEEQQRQQRAG